VPVEPARGEPEEPDDGEREEDEVAREDGIGDEGVEGLVGEVAGVVERVPPCWSAGKPVKKTSVVAWKRKMASLV
jgi:hypothetical protein